MTRFLLTGATGFIGGAIVRRLVAEGYDVVALGKSGIDLLSASDADLAAVVRKAKSTHCIHAAWYTNHADYLVDDVNHEWVAASQRLANAFSGRFCALGTCFEYDAAHADGPYVEGQTPLDPQTVYARSKAELFEALQQRGGDFAWARVFFVYGPGDREGRLVPKLLETFQRGESFEPTFGGLRRDYIHVDDLAGQIVRIALSPIQGAINTGTGEAPTLSEVVETAARAVGRPELARTNQLTGDEPPIIAADLARFRSEIGDPEARSFAEGVAEVFRTRLRPPTLAR